MTKIYWWVVSVGVVLPGPLCARLNTMGRYYKVQNPRENGNCVYLYLYPPYDYELLASV